MDLDLIGSDCISNSPNPTCPANRAPAMATRRLRHVLSCTATARHAAAVSEVDGEEEPVP